MRRSNVCHPAVPHALAQQGQHFAELRGGAHHRGGLGFVRAVVAADVDRGALDGQELADDGLLVGVSASETAAKAAASSASSLWRASSWAQNLAR